MSRAHSGAKSASIPIQTEADVRCVKAHDLCWQGGPCPYCEVICHRDTRGRFAARPHTDAEDALRAEDWFHDSDMGAR